MFAVRYQKPQAGFTLIEMIVSLALFSIVMTVAVGSLLMLIGANDELQAEQNVMTSLSFALDSMSREIRTGTNYVCETSSNNNGNNVFNDSRDLDVLLAPDEAVGCPNGRGAINGNSNRFHGVAFVEAGDSITGSTDERIMYFHDHVEQMLYRKVGGEAAVPILADDVVVLDADFFVSAPEPLSAATPNLDQPAVTIHIEAQASNNLDAPSYFVQTTVSQRILDL